MYTNVNLTAKEFTDIHNALYYLECIDTEEVNIQVNKIRAALKSAYAQEDEVFDRRRDHYADVRSQLGLDHSVWSVYEVDDLSERHPFEGADRVVYKDHWGKQPVSCSINGLTWAALYIAANACIRDSGDTHHCFIEQFIVSEDDSRTLKLMTGS